MKVRLVPNADLDFFLSVIGEADIPTKQDKFESLSEFEVYQIDVDGNQIKLDEHDLYLKKRGKDSLREFEQKFRERLNSEIFEPPLFENGLLEVIVGLHMSESRFKSVDLDNLLKSIFDCMNGIVYKDDNQISNIIASKKINAIPKYNGLYIGVRVLSDNKKSYFDNFRFGHFEEIDE